MSVRIFRVSVEDVRDAMESFDVDSEWYYDIEAQGTTNPN